MQDISSGNFNLYSLENLKFCVLKVLEENNYQGYSSPKGMKSLRKAIASLLEQSWHFPVDPSQMIITSGSQQSIHLLVEAFLKEKESILIEQPTYFGAMKLFRNRKLQMIGVTIQEEGIDLKALENILKKETVKWIYVVPTFNNPTGYAWTKQNRIDFLDLVNRYHLYVIEDDPYSLIRFTNDEYPTLYELNKGKNVLYLGTFSKYISASINVGYIIAEQEIIPKLYEYKEAFDLGTSLFHQQVIFTYLENFNLILEIEKKISSYKEHLENAMKLLKEKYGDHIELTIPKGGLFFLVCCKDNRFPFVDKQHYFINQKQEQYVRVNICSFSNLQSYLNKDCLPK